MKWFRSLLIIANIGVLFASSIGDDGALGHRRGGNSNDKGKQSGGDSDLRKQSDDSGRSRDRIGIGGSETAVNPTLRDRGGRSSDSLNGQGEIRNLEGDPFVKRKSGATATVVYGTVNNLRRDPALSSRPPERDRPPIDVFNPSLTTMVRREDNVVRHARYRTGYYHYNAGWRDDDFIFGFYSFTPVYDRCVVSPFYYYPFLPPYVSRSRVLVLRVGNVSIYADDGPNYYWDRGIDYRWTRSYWYEPVSRRSELDYALDNLVDAWKDSDRRALNRLIPDWGSIGIYVDERYNYSLSADDFYDMMLDNIRSARTRAYDILSVKKYRNEARVVAVHEYIDPWGRRERVYHVYRLVDEGYGYKITDFGTSDRRPRR